ncbi:MAG: hypothetical protein KF784_11870 [Fimbriimonadaceae bacterium]|nr:hypothetical protein [Fimbriimonadaceae bacterium]
MTAIHKFVEQAKAGELPNLVCQVRSGWLIMGGVQVVKGYCLLLPDPVPAHLNDMDAESRLLFLADMASIGDAILELAGAARINYEMLGNLEPALHAHLFPRYASEPDDLRAKPIWFYDWSAARPFSKEEDGEFAIKLAARLAEIGIAI